MSEAVAEAATEAAAEAATEAIESGAAEEVLLSKGTLALVITLRLLSDLVKAACREAGWSVILDSVSRFLFDLISLGHASIIGAEFLHSYRGSSSQALVPSEACTIEETCGAKLLIELVHRLLCLLTVVSIVLDLLLWFRLLDGSLVLGLGLLRF